jgi:hypothetical protein
MVMIAAFTAWRRSSRSAASSVSRCSNRVRAAARGWQSGDEFIEEFIKEFACVILGQGIHGKAPFMA